MFVDINVAHDTKKLAVSSGSEEAYSVTSLAMQLCIQIIGASV